MKYVHSQGIIHRDLKPANILLDADCRGLICDFGASRWTSDEDFPSPHEGTFAYAAPEQWEPKRRYTPKVDVFAFGLIAYEIITGRRVVRSTRSSKMPDVPLTSGPVPQDLIRRCWSLRPSERPSFEAILNEFNRSGWQILPHADVNIIAESVSEVTRLENARNPRQ
jgi:serine/threonine protein kinase